MLRIAYLAAGVVGFAVTMLPRGATLIYLWPWPLILTLALAVPPGAMAIRLWRGEKIPSPGPTIGLSLAALGALLVISAWASPFHGAAEATVLLPLSAIALVFEVGYWRTVDPEADGLLERALAWVLVLFTIDSLVLWVTTTAIPNGTEHLWDARNPHPLGHSNYTAGAILLLLPFGAARAWRTSGRARTGWVAALVLAVLCLFTSGSRAAILGVAAGAIVGGTLLVRSGLLPLRRALLLAGLCCGAAAIIAVANPRIRGMLRPSTAVVPDDSTLQRNAMLAVGEKMLASRPMIGWGPGTTPLAYPRFRAQVAGGVDSALQLHNTPVQVAADLGVTGAALLALIILAGAVACWRASRGNETQRLPVAVVAGTALAAYGAFALFDFEFDVPFFVVACAVAFALCLPRAAGAWLPRWPVGTIVALALVAGLAGRVPSLRSHWRLAGAVDALDRQDESEFRKLAELAARADPTETTALNALGFHFGEQALTVSDKTLQLAESQLAIAYFTESLQRNPRQEIVETNLAWLLLPRDPSAAEAHFLYSAALLPEKEGLGVGLAKARLAQGNRNGAISALAAECLMNPPYLFSVDWKTDPLAGLRNDVLARLIADTIMFARQPEVPEWQRAALVNLRTVAGWLAGTKKTEDVAEAALSRGQGKYFASGQAQALLDRWKKSSGGEDLMMRARRPGYSVLMRNLDAPMPADFYWSRHDRAVVAAGADLVPARLHLPGWILLAELRGDSSASR